MYCSFFALFYYLCVVNAPILYDTSTFNILKTQLLGRLSTRLN